MAIEHHDTQGSRAEVAVASTDDTDGNTYDQVILGTGISNNSW